MSREAWIAVGVLGGVLAVTTLAGAVVLAVRVLRTRRLLGELGMGGRVAFYGALIYTVFPVDLLPDPIYLDDMGVLAGALIYLTRLAAQRRTARSASRDVARDATSRTGPTDGPARVPSHPVD
ncbi:YkvA family protein [Micromonospora sp. CPCC 206060]|uniref:YkvA family protein n=1 Tax=Micromonospora sp. CPCC 206060 TaxID=3122406 RepID=UPI002FF05599